MKALLVVAFAFAGCASTELELPNDHPANANATAQPPATSQVLRSDYDPFADDAEPAQEQHHHHHGKGSGK